MNFEKNYENLLMGVETGMEKLMLDFFLLDKHNELHCCP